MEVHVRRINAPGPSLAGCMPPLCFQYRFTLLIGFVARHGSAPSLLAPLSLSGNAKPLAPLVNPVLRNETPVLPPPLTLPMQTTNEACVYENKPAWLFSTGSNRSPATRLVLISPSSGRTECLFPCRTRRSISGRTNTRWKCRHVLSLQRQVERSITAGSH